MSQTVTGVLAPAAIGRIDGHTNYASKAYVVTSGVTINAGDFVYFASGCVTNATVNGARILGMAEGTATGTATGTVTVLVCIDRNMQYLVKTAAALTVANGTNAYVGTYFDLSGGTGATNLNIPRYNYGSIPASWLYWYEWFTVFRYKWFDQYIRYLYISKLCSKPIRIWLILGKELRNGICKTSMA